MSTPAVTLKFVSKRPRWKRLLGYLPLVLEIAKILICLLIWHHTTFPNHRADSIWSSTFIVACFIWTVRLIFEERRLKKLAAASIAASEALADQLERLHPVWMSCLCHQEFVALARIEQYNMQNTPVQDIQHLLVAHGSHPIVLLKAGECPRCFALIKADEQNNVTIERGLLHLDEYDPFERIIPELVISSYASEL